MRNISPESIVLSSTFSLSAFVDIAADRFGNVKDLSATIFRVAGALLFQFVEESMPLTFIVLELLLSICFCTFSCFDRASASLFAALECTSTFLLSSLEPLQALFVLSLDTAVAFLILGNNPTTAFFVFVLDPTPTSLVLCLALGLAFKFDN
jgi:hypothetical protein